MITRIVKMVFEDSFIAEFKLLFNQKKEAIRNQTGCLDLELIQSIDNPCIFMTYSHWKAPQFLEDYKETVLFKETWAATKKGFSAKPEAWSLESLHKLA
ncbi:MAG: quinol monooxygenase YgiN [Luteibaculaceae bacterium]|jgi:quinol monooxygenase YgiN